MWRKACGVEHRCFRLQAIRHSNWSFKGLQGRQRVCTEALSSTEGNWEGRGLHEGCFAAAVDEGVDLVGLQFQVPVRAYHRYRPCYCQVLLPPSEMRHSVDGLVIGGRGWGIANGSDSL